MFPRSEQGSPDPFGRRSLWSVQRRRMDQAFHDLVLGDSQDRCRTIQEVDGHREGEGRGWRFGLELRFYLSDATRRWPSAVAHQHSFGSGYREACTAPQGQKGQGFLLDEDPVSHCSLGPPSSKSTFLTLDFAKLTIQMGAPMQWHHHMNGTKVRQHARRLDGGPTLTCGDLFPDLFFYTGRNHGHPEGWDASLFGCKNCDVHVLVSVSISL